MLKRLLKARASMAVSPAVDFADPEVKWALQGDCLTLSLTKFVTRFTASLCDEGRDYAKAYGFVDFGGDCERIIRCEINLCDGGGMQTDNFGRVILEIEGKRGNMFVLLSAFINDPRRDVEKFLQHAFDSAAISNSQLVRLILRREELDVNVALQNLQDKGHFEHPLTQIALRHETVLPCAPAWSMAWSRDW